MDLDVVLLRLPAKEAHETDRTTALRVISPNIPGPEPHPLSLAVRVRAVPLAGLTATTQAGRRRWNPTGSVGVIRLVRLVSCLAVLGLVLGVVGCGGDRKESRSSAFRAETTPRIHLDQDRLLGFQWPAGGVGEIELAELDPVTLAPKSRPIGLGTGGHVTELSPDGTTLALGGGDARRIEFLDLEKMRVLGAVDLGMPGYVSRLSWRPTGMLFAAIGQSSVVLVNPGARQLVETRHVDGLVLGDLHAIPAGMLALVGPSEGIGPLKAVVFGGKGTIAAPLREIVGGSITQAGDDDEGVRITENIPGLAVDPTGRRALVVPAGGEVAEISLANLRVTYHSLSQPVSLLERLRNWLEPTAEAKLIEGPTRQAVWLKSGLVAVTGADHTVSDEREVVTEPAGLSLIDTRDWSVRLINEQVDWVLPSGEHLLAFEPWCAGDRESYGVVAYDLEGTELFRMCRDEGFDPQVVGNYAYLGFANNTRFEVVDLESGEIVARPTTTKTTSLITNLSAG